MCTSARSCATQDSASLPLRRLKPDTAWPHVAQILPQSVSPLSIQVECFNCGAGWQEYCKALFRADRISDFLAAYEDGVVMESWDTDRELAEMWLEVLVSQVRICVGAQQSRGKSPLATIAFMSVNFAQCGWDGMRAA